MRIRRVTALFFSPTGSTAAVTKEIGTALVNQLRVPFHVIDCTLPQNRVLHYEFGSEDFLIAGAPVYAGKLPNKIAPFFRSVLHGGRTPAAGIVTFGNRSFDNALAEWRGILADGGFLPVGFAAFVSRHAFSDRIAPGRPSESDLTEARSFAERLASLLKGGDTSRENWQIPDVPGDASAPYYIPTDIEGRPSRFLKAKPLTRAEQCTRCGECVSVCPMGSISSEDPAQVTGICIKCQACVRRCPAGAKYFDDSAFLSHVRMLEERYTSAQKNSFFLP